MSALTAMDGVISTVSALRNMPIDVLIQHGLSGPAINFLRVHKRITNVDELRRIEFKTIQDFPVEIDDKKVLRQLVEQIVNEAALASTKDVPTKNTFIHFNERQPCSVEEFADASPVAPFSAPPVLNPRTPQSSILYSRPMASGCTTVTEAGLKVCSTVTEFAEPGAQAPCAPAAYAMCPPESGFQMLAPESGSKIPSVYSNVSQICSTMTEVEEPGAQRPFLAMNLSDVFLPTPGSKDHAAGACTPCAWNHTSEGCRHGAKCIFCHFCDAGEIKRRKKAKKKMLRAEAAVQAEAESQERLKNIPLAPRLPTGYAAAAGFDLQEAVVACDEASSKRGTGFFNMFKRCNR